MSWARGGRTRLHRPGWCREAGPALREFSPPGSGRRHGRIRHTGGGGEVMQTPEDPLGGSLSTQSPRPALGLTWSGWGDAGEERSHARYSDGHAHRIFSWIGRRAAGREEGGPKGFLAGFSLPRQGGPRGRGMEG